MNIIHIFVRPNKELVFPAKSKIDSLTKLKN